jgi:hypothetical protein
LYTTALTLLIAGECERVNPRNNSNLIPVSPFGFQWELLEVFADNRHAYLRLRVTVCIKKFSRVSSYICISTKEAAMKLKQKRKNYYSYHDTKGSCGNNEVTFPSRKTGYDRHCHDLFRQVLPRQRLLVHFL